MEFIDYCNLNLDLKTYNDITIKVTGTSFAYNVYYLKDKCAADWSINIDRLNSEGNKGIDARIKYKDKSFKATLNAQPDQNGTNIITKLGKKFISANDQTGIEAPVSRCTNGYFKISTGFAFTSAIGDAFWATRLAYRMKKERQKIDLGEFLKVRVYYVVLKGEPKVILEILDLCTLDTKKIQPKTISLYGEKIPYNFCKKIEERFEAEHICIQPETPANDIIWSNPTDWIYPADESQNPQYKAAFQVKYAVYMWIGIKDSEPSKKYLYIGIVGVDRNKKNTVGNRIFNQEMKTGIAAENNIDHIECFRYSELKNSGNCSAEQILQTVEMQCINNFSSFFSYNVQIDPIIHNLFDGICKDGKNYTLQLLNNKIRYNNSKN